jgi:hypothetical protein
MFDKLDDADCVARKINLPTTNDGGDRSLPNQPFVLFLPSLRTEQRDYETIMKTRESVVYEL